MPEPIPGPCLPVPPACRTKICFPASKLLAALLLPALLAAASCGGDGGVTLRVMTASSLTEAFQDLARDFEAGNPGVRVALEFGGSQRLRSQLEFGARADVFASADSRQMDQAVAAGLTEGDAVDLAVNTLVVIAVAGGRVERLQDLATPGVRLVLAHGGVPVGGYSRQVLRNLAKDGSLGLGGRFDEAVMANLVSEETNVRAVAQKVALGEADAGIVYRTDAAVAQAAGAVRVISIPATANVRARYPIAVLREAPEAALARRFVRFVLSEPGQRRLAEHGFARP